MGIATDKLLEKALLLPADERASLVEKLLQSLNLPTEAEVNRLWVEETERRVSQIKVGRLNSSLVNKSSQGFERSTNAEVQLSS